MTSLPSRFPGKNANLWFTSLTTKSPCRSPHRRLNSTSSHFTKTRRLRHHPHNTSTTNNKNRYFHTIFNLIPVGCSPSQPHMFTTNRPKIPHCILINQSHGFSNCSNHNPNSMSPSRGNNSNNCPRVHIINTILFSQHHIRTNTYTHPYTYTRVSQHPSNNNSLMTYR